MRDGSDGVSVTSVQPLASEPPRGGSSAQQEREPTAGKQFFFVFFLRTCARHLERIGVGAVVAIAANAVHGSLAGGAAVDGALQAGLVTLGRLEVAGWAG